jgi:6-phosphogluconolactonase (cycloisomerase 2 family)
LKPSCFPAAAIMLTATLLLAGCNGSSNNRSAYNPDVITSPGTFPSQIAYVGDSGDDTVKAYSITTGSSTTNPISVTSLSSTGTVSGGTPEALAVDPARHFLFVADADDNYYLEVFELNSNGSVPSSPVTSVVVPNGLAHDNSEIAVAAPVGAPSNTEYVYIATSSLGTLNAYQFDTSTNTLTSFTPGVSSSDTPFSLTTDGNGAHLFSGGAFGNPRVTSYTINAANGDLTSDTYQASGQTAPVFVVNDPASSFVYSYDKGAKYLYAYSTAGGTLTAGNYLSTTQTGNDLAIAPDGSALYLSNGTTGTVTSSVIGSNGNLGTPTTTSAVSGTNLIGVAVDSSSQYVVTLDQTSDSILAYHITAPGQLAAPIAAQLTSGSNPVAALFVPVARPV